MKIEKVNYKEVVYESGQKLFFDKKHSFHEHFKHKRRTIKFPFHKNILQFLSDNPGVDIFFTLDEDTKPFKKTEEGFLINMVSYFEFCKTIGSKTGGRSKAFLGQNVSLEDVSFSDKDRDEFIRANASEINILEAIRSFSPEVRDRIKKSLDIVNTEGLSKVEEESITKEEFIEAFTDFLTNSEVQVAFYKQLPRIQIETLKSHISFLRSNLDKNETFIQNWLDEDSGKFRKQRCLIFGLEYVDPKREGELSSKRFDLLAEQDLEHFVIFELKSPKDPIFKIETTDTVAGGISTAYNLSPQLARAIPEVLGYKKLFDDATNEELQKFGVKIKKPVSKCVIVLGTRQDDPVWRGNFERIANCFNGIELLTYSHLIDRLENIVRNLEQNTSEVS